MGEILFDTMSWVSKVLKLKQLPRRKKKKKTFGLKTNADVTPY